MHALLLGALFLLALMAVGGAALDVIAARRKALRARLLESEGLGRAPEPASSRGSLLGALARIGAALLPGGASRTLEDQLAQAGYYGRSAAATYIGWKMILLIVGLAVSAFFVLSTDVRLHVKVLLIVAGGGVMFCLPNSLLELRRRKRRQQVRGHLPDAIDLMEVCVSSGMGLDMAWNVVADEIRGVAPTLAQEMALTDLEIHLGASRLDATKHMAERTGVEEVSSFASMLVQSERFGTSIADGLRTFATSVREERSQRAQETAEKTAVKLIFPMAILIFPAMLVVLVSPGILKLMEVLGGRP